MCAKKNAAKSARMSQDDYPLRVKFCDWVLSGKVYDPALTELVLFTNEASFTRTHFCLRKSAFVYGYQKRVEVTLWAGAIGNN